MPARSDILVEFSYCHNKQRSVRSAGIMQGRLMRWWFVRSGAMSRMIFRGHIVRVGFDIFHAVD